MTLDLVIITFNRENEIRRTMDRLIPSVSRFDSIIVIDNDSKDGTKAVLAGYKDRIPNLRLIFSDKNTGVAGGRNIGVRESSADILVFLDDDAEFVEPDFAERIERKFREDASLGALAVKIVNAHTGLVQKNEFPHWNKSGIGKDADFQAAYFVGAGHAISRKALDAAGFYPEEFFYSQEELFLSYKIIQAGFRIVYSPTVTVLHRQAPAGRLANNRKWFLLLRNTLLINYKFLPIGLFALSIPVWAAKVLVLCKDPASVAGALKDFNRMRAKGPFRREPFSREALSYVKNSGGRVYW